MRMDNNFLDLFTNDWARGDTNVNNPTTNLENDDLTTPYNEVVAGANDIINFDDNINDSVVVVPKNDPMSIEPTLDPPSLTQFTLVPKRRGRPVKKESIAVQKIMQPKLEFKRR